MQRTPQRGALINRGGWGSHLSLLNRDPRREDLDNFLMLLTSHFQRGRHSVWQCNPRAVCIIIYITLFLEIKRSTVSSKKRGWSTKQFMNILDELNSLCNVLAASAQVLKFKYTALSYLVPIHEPLPLLYPTQSCGFMIQISSVCLKGLESDQNRIKEWAGG